MLRPARARAHRLPFAMPIRVERPINRQEVRALWAAVLERAFKDLRDEDGERFESARAFFELERGSTLGLASRATGLEVAYLARLASRILRERLGPDQRGQGGALCLLLNGGMQIRARALGPGAKRDRSDSEISLPTDFASHSELYGGGNAEAERRAG